jgi:hypothetical protein
MTLALDRQIAAVLAPVMVHAGDARALLAGDLAAGAARPSTRC